MEISEEEPTSNQWNEELCLQLIDLYRMLPQLWDKNDPIYYKKEKKDEAWKNIGRVLEKSPQECKHKMSVLFSSFRREKAKIMNSIQESKSSGGPSTYASNWFGFAAMSFLLIKQKHPKAAKRKPRNDTLRKVFKEALEAEKVRQAKFAVHNKPNYKVCSIPIPSTSTGKTDADRSDTPKDEELKPFADFVASKMKKYSESTRSAVQQAICDILFKADQRYYERANSTVTSTNTVNMMPRVVIRAEENVQALILKEEDLGSDTE